MHRMTERYLFAGLVGCIAYGLGVGFHLTFLFGLFYGAWLYHKFGADFLKNR